MTEVLEPRDERDLVGIVESLAVAGEAVTIFGRGSKSKIGRPGNVRTLLSTARLSGITLHEPSELVIAAKAGTPLSDVEKALDAASQRLPFEPMSYAPLFGAPDSQTMGGITAANVSGPRRISAGACRDSLIGVRLVNGCGELVKSGGRVMKNVTGLDLVKLVCGAWGTLGIMSEVVFKVLPKPERSASLIIDDLDDETAVIALSAALGSPYEVSGAAHFPKTVVPSPLTAVRIEGFDESVTYRLKSIAKSLGRFGLPRVLEGDASRDFWLRVRDVQWLVNPADAAVWRLSVAPSNAARIVAAIRHRLDARHMYDWGGGLVWLAVEASNDAGAAAIRGAMRGSSGHATLVRAPDTVRAAVDVYQPLSPALRKLTVGIKASFDPHGIFNPGRMYAGI